MSLIRRRSPDVVDGDGPRTADGGAGTPTSGGRPSARHGTVRRLVQGLLVVVAGTAALSLAGPFALRPFADVAGAAGQVTVAFVLDFGGTPAKLVVGCVTVPDSDSRYDALTAFTASKGLAPPTFASSGLLCSIGGTPASGCGQVVAGGYEYWAYYTGGLGGWSYASSGAFATVTPGDVEGWRFQDPGTGRPNDPPPRSTARYGAICPSTPTTTTTPPAPPVTQATTPIPGGTTAGGGGPGTSGAHPHRAAKAPAAVAASGTTSTTTTTSTYPPDTTTSLPSTDVPPDPVVGVTSAAHHAVPGNGPDPLIVGGIVVAGLAIAAWFRWRRRPRTP
jgi:hypothetical protein